MRYKCCGTYISTGVLFLESVTKYLEDIHDYGASDKYIKLILHIASACNLMIAIWKRLILA